MEKIRRGLKVLIRIYLWQSKSNRWLDISSSLHWMSAAFEVMARAGAFIEVSIDVDDIIHDDGR